MIGRVIALILFNALWQPLLIATASILVLRLARKASASTRCSVLVAAVIVALLLPIVTVLVYHGAAHGVPNSRVATAQTPVRTEAQGPRAYTQHVNAPEDQGSGRAWWSVQRPFITVPDLVIRVTDDLWAAIACVLLLRLLISFAYLAELYRSATPYISEVTSLRVCTSDKISVPIALGTSVLLPRKLVTELNVAELNCVILHEAAHVARHDRIVHVLQNLGLALFFFSPGLIALVRALNIEREVACDDWVLQQSDATSYAKCLVRLADHVPSRGVLPVLGAFATNHAISIRVRRILQDARDARIVPARGPIAVSLTAIVLVAALTLSLAPSLAFGTSSPSSAQQTKTVSPPVNPFGVNLPWTRVSAAGLTLWVADGSSLSKNERRSLQKYFGPGPIYYSPVLMLAQVASSSERPVIRGRESRNGRFTGLFKWPFPREVKPVVGPNGDRFYAAAVETKPSTRMVLQAEAGASKVSMTLTIAAQPEAYATPPPLVPYNPFGVSVAWMGVGSQPPNLTLALGVAKAASSAVRERLLHDPRLKTIACTGCTIPILLIASVSSGDAKPVIHAAAYRDGKPVRTVNISFSPMEKPIVAPDGHRLYLAVIGSQDSVNWSFEARAASADIGEFRFAVR